MNAIEREGLAAKLHAQMDRSASPSETPTVELEDVKDWIELQKQECEPCSEPSVFLNLI